MKLQPFWPKGLKTWNFIKETPAQVFCCEIREIFKNTYFEEHLRMTDFVW